MRNFSFVRVAFSALRFPTAWLALTVVPFMLFGCDSRPTAPSTQNSSQAVASPTNSRPVIETQTGLASFIGKTFQGRQTASGEVLDQSQMVAAHTSYPMGTIVRVTNLENERAIEVRIIDRGAAGRNQADGIVDLSRAAAERLGMVQEGRVRVRVEVLEWGSGSR